MIDLFKIFARTFAEYYKEKRLAKKQIKFLEECHSTYKRIKTLLSDVHRTVIHVHQICPTNRGYGCEDFQQFDNFLMYGYHYGGDGDRVGRGYIQEISTRHLAILESCIEHAKEAYKEKRYEDVEKMCRRYAKECERFDDTYGTHTVELAKYPKSNEQK